MRAALQEDRADPGGAELIERRADTRRLVLARGDDDVYAVGLERIGGGAAGRARDHNGQRRLAGVADQAGADGEPSEGVEDHPPRLPMHAVDAGRQGSGSSASAVPIPTATASHSARQWWARCRLASQEIHFESPALVATFPSSVIADLKRNRDPGAGMLAEGLDQEPGASGGLRPPPARP